MLYAILLHFYVLFTDTMSVWTRDGSNPEAKDSNPNPNHFILLESESESLHFARIRIRIRIHSSFQWIRILIRILVQRIRIRIRESTVNMHDMHDLKAQYRVDLPSYVLHIQTLIYLNVLALLIL